MGRYINSVPQILDTNGNPIVGAKKFMYESGTSILKSVFSDSSNQIPAANPVVSDAGGRFPEFFIQGLYREVQTDASGLPAAEGVVIWTRDPIGEISTSQFSDWVNDAFYSFNDIVRGSDLAFYKSLVAGINTNQGNDPISSPAQWGDATFMTLGGVETGTNKTFPAPNISDAVFSGTQTGFTGDVAGDVSGKSASSGKLIDSNDVDALLIETVASAVNELTVKNSATGNAVEIKATGDDTNIGITIIPKGAGSLTLPNDTILLANMATDSVSSDEIVDDSVTVDEINTVLGTNTDVSLNAAATWAQPSDGYYYVEALPASTTFSYQIFWNGTWTTKQAFTDDGNQYSFWIISGSTRIINTGGLARSLRFQKFIG